MQVRRRMMRSAAAAFISHTTDYFTRFDIKVNIYGLGFENVFAKVRKKFDAFANNEKAAQRFLIFPLFFYIFAVFINNKTFGLLNDFQLVKQSVPFS